MSGKGLLAIGLAVIAAVFLALVIQARSDGGGGPSFGRTQRAALAEHPERADCAPAVEHALDAAGSRVEDMFGAGVRTRLRDAAIRLCHEDAWPTDVIDCLRGADHDSALSSCVGQLPPDAHAHLMAELERIPRTYDDPPPPDADDSGTFGYGDLSVDAAVPSGLPEECGEYGRIIENIANCDRLPQQSRDALRQAYDQMKSAWAGLATSDTAREAMATGCREATTALNQAMSSLCP